MTPNEPRYGTPDDENPEWTAENFANARPLAEVLPALAASLRRIRGSQKAPTKRLISLRLDQDGRQSHPDVTGATFFVTTRTLDTPIYCRQVLSRERPLTVEMIHKISEGWGLPADVLVRPYKLRPPPSS